MHSCIYKQVKTSLKWSLVIFRLLVPWKEKNSALGLNLSCVCYQALFLLQTAVQWRILFCFPLWMFGGHLTCETGEEAQLLVRKVDPTTTQIMMDVTALAHVQFKFWLCLFQCPSNSDVGVKSELVFIYLFIFPCPRDVMVRPFEKGIILKTTRVFRDYLPGSLLHFSYTWNLAMFC